MLLLFGVVAVMSEASAQTYSTVQFIDATNAVAAGSEVIRSADGGVSWFVQPTGTANNWFGVSFQSSSTGTIVGGLLSTFAPAVLKTTNSGSSWITEPGSSTILLQGVTFVDANIGYAVGRNGSIMKTTNGGASWTNQASGTTQTLYKVSFSDANNGVAVGSFGVIVRTTNGGANWSTVATGTTAYLYGVSFSSPTTGTAVGNAGAILRTVNGGASWSSQLSGQTYDLRAVDCIDDNTITAVGTTGKILRSTNGGSSWTLQTSGTANDLGGVSFSNANTGIAVGAVATILRTTNGGATWSPSSVSSGGTPPAAPTLATPTNGATGQPTTLTLGWNPSSGATTYRLQVSTSSSFSPLVVDDSTLSVTSRSVSALLNNTTYYWRVDAKNSYGTSAWSTTWSFTTVQAPPGAFSLLAPTSGSTGQALSGTLSWQAAANATGYDVYLDVNNPPTTLVSSSQVGTSYAYSVALSGTTYYWKVVAKNAGGSTTATASPWNFATLAAAPSAFNLLSPATGSTGQALSGTLSWAAATGATSYDVYLGSANPPTTIVSTSQAGTSYAYSGLANGITYYWKVVAKNAGGSTTATSSPWNFTTIVAAPSAFLLTSPATGATGQSLSGTLSWAAATGATSYDVYLDGSNPPTTIVSTSQAGTSYAYSGLLNGSTYYWKVVAKNAGGSTTSTSAPWNFTTIVAAPSAFNLLSPATGSTGLSLTGTLSWAAAAGATGYDVYLDGNNPPTTIVSTNQAGTSYGYTAALNGSTYYWKVVAKNAGGSTTSSLSPWNFVTIVGPPPAPVLLSPASGAANVATTATYSWNASAGATSYRLQVGTDSTFATGKVVDDSSLTLTSRLVGPLANNTKYYWRVNAKGVGGTGAYSATWNLTTIPSVPTVTTTAATLVTSSSATANGTVNPNGVATTAWFEWGTSSTLATYSSTVSQAVGSGSTAAAVSAGLTSLSPNTTYYYRVAAQNSAGTSRDGIVSFTTGAVLPTVTTTAPTLVTSSSGTANGTVNPNGATTTAWFEWGTSSTLSTYTSTVSQSVGSGTTASAVSANLSSLSPNTTYYYRVAAQNSAGTQRDGILSFTTGAVLPTVTTTAATSVTSSAATTNGTVNPNGNATTAWFEWGTSSTLATFSSTTSQAVGSGTAASAVSASLTSLSPNTVYYYRLAAQNGAGTQRDGILSFTTSAVLPTVTTTAATSVGTTGATMNGTANPNGASTSIWFEWGTSSTLATFNSTTLQAIGAGTSATAVSANLSGLTSGTVYYFRLAGQNAAGTQKSSILNFTTLTAPPPPPAVPTLASPATGSLNQATTLTLSWNASSGAATYRLQVSASSTFSTLFLDDSTLATTSRQVSGLANSTPYYWRVSASNAGGSSGFSASWTFTTIMPAPGAFSLTAPANGATGQATSGSLSWQASSNATVYDVYLGQSNPPTTVVSSGQVPTTFNYGGLATGATYFWKVVAKNIAGSVTASGAPWSFTTVSNAPTVVSSAATSVSANTAQLNGTVNPNGVATTCWFEWSTSSTLTTYTSTGAQSMGSGTSAVGASAGLISLNSGTLYYYRIAAQSAAGVSRGSIVSFTTLPTWTLTAASLNPSTGVALTVSPLDRSGFGNGSTQFTRSYDNGVSVTLTAPATAGGNNFQKWQRDGVDLSTNASVSFPMDANHTLTAVYVIPAPPAVVLLSPANGAIGQPVSSLVLSWNAAAGAATYRLQVSSSSTFATTVLDDSTLTATTATISGLSVNTTYYWRVDAKNSSGTGPWSAQWTFVTKKGGKPKLSTVTINFGTVPIGTSKKDSFVVTNVGDTSIVVTSIATTDQTFQVSKAGVAIAPGDSAQFFVSASPQSANAISGLVIVTYDAALPADTVTAQVDSVSEVAGVGDGLSTQPMEFALYQNYPNPFNPSTKIRYQLARESEVTLAVYNAFGQEVALLVESIQSPGVHEVTFDGTNLSSGVYFYKLRAGTDVAMKKFMLMK